MHIHSGQSWLKAGLGVSMGLLLCAWDCSAVKVGLFKDKTSTALQEIAKTLKANGIEAEEFTTADIAEGKIYGYDALYFGGGWNGIDWLDLNARMHVVEFVRNRGGGAIFSMFRCGWAGRSGIRPLFPEIAWADNKANLDGIGITLTNHPVVLGLPPDFNTPAADHAVMQLGPEGEVLARDTNGDIVIACGQAGKGRVVFLGPWIGLDQDQKTPYPMPAIDEKLLLNSIGWVTAPAAKVAGTETNVSDEVKLRVLRREKIMDWTHDEERLTIFTGILTEAFDLSEETLDSLQIRADRLAPFADTQSSQRLSDVRKNIERLRAKIALEYAQAKQKKIDEIAKMPIAELEKEPVRDLYITRNKAAVESYKKQMEAFREQFLPSSAVAPVETEVASNEEALAPKILEAERRKAAGEKERDAKAAPGLIEALKSPEVFTREEAAMELGRMGNRQAIPALVKALEDKEYPVRRNAIYALGWMQAKEAVPALLALAENTQDIRIRRRAVEALGLIGDAKAVGFLVKALKDPDRFVRQNAILSLGWLGDKKAAAPLIEILSAPLDEIDSVVIAPVYKQDMENGWTLEDIVCAVRALGHIGDTNAVPALEECRRKHKKEKEKPSLYFTSMKMEDAVETALKEIEQGGRKERGVRQPEFSSLYENFYWLPRRYNAFYGRIFLHGRHPKDWKKTADYTASGGGSGFIEFLTLCNLTGGGRGRSEARRQAVRKEMEIPTPDKWLDYLSKVNLAFLPTWNRRGTAILDKAGFESDVFQWGSYSGLKGFWAEETLWWSRELRNDEAFRAYLAKKYKENELAGFGIKDISRVKCPPSNDEGRKQKFLWAEYMEHISDVGVDAWGEAAEWLTALRQGTYLAYSLSSRYRSGHATYISAYPRVTQAIGVNGPQTYSEHAFVNNFDLEMHVDGESRPVIGEWYAMGAASADRVERGFASSFVHGQCFFECWWGFVFKHISPGPGSCGNWQPGRWEAAERQFRKGKAISKFLAPVESPKLIALLYSGRTTTLTYGNGIPDGTGSKTHRYTQNQQGIWEALMQLHLPVDILWMETLTPEKLARYKVAVLSAAKSLSPGEISMLREWVRRGGVLVSSGDTSLNDQWDRPQADYALGDVFGVKYETTQMTDKEGFRRFVRRSYKPAKVDTLKLTAADYIKHSGGKETAEYERAIGFDAIKLTQGKAVAAWADGSPAMVENRCGNGLCVFLSPIYPGLCFKWVDVGIDPLYLEYWPGAKELIGAAVGRGLEFASAAPPMEVANCPHYVEAVLKIQEKRKRVMAHLLNMDYRIDLVENVDVKLSLPGKTITALYYPYPKEKAVEYVREGDAVKFKVRRFETHEMVVAEWEEKPGAVGAAR